MGVTLILKNGDHIVYADAARVEQSPRSSHGTGGDCLLITSGDGETYKVHGEIALHEVATILFDDGKATPSDEVI
jgi:hypothetical protein